MKQEQKNKAISVLQDIQPIVSERTEAPKKLEKIMKLLALRFKADMAAAYMTVDDHYLALFCSSDEQNTLKTTIRYGEGFIGKTASMQQTLCTDCVTDQNCPCILGTPLLQWNKTSGVLLLFNKEKKVYEPSEIEAFESVAMFLTTFFSTEEIVHYKKKLAKSRGLYFKDRLKGLVINKGYGIGVAVVHRRTNNVKELFGKDKALERQRLLSAREKMTKSLDEKFDAQKIGSGVHAEILETYRMFAQDKGWYKKIDGYIETGLTAEAAIERAYEDLNARLSESRDIYLKERLHDMRDIADRLCRFLNQDEKKISPFAQADDIVLVAKTMGPADLMDYDYKKIRALILEDGTPTMHVSIVARALNIPAITKTYGLFQDVKEGEILAVDGQEGYVYVHPTPDIVQKFEEKQKEARLLADQLKKLTKQPSKTLDGVKISLNLNVGLDFDFDYIETTRPNGIGLYRTEMPFMSSDSMPDGKTQTAFYQKLLDRAGHKKVIFRSLDVGSDKLLPYWGELSEPNPAIGWRSIRITLDRRAILRQQMKAFIKAAAGKELNVMFPMIADLEEFLEAKETLLLELEKEKTKGLKMPSKVNIGLMIEVPSIIFQLDDVLKKADFISIGTNDLAQFMFACDRSNPRITNRYDVLSAPFLRVMQQIIQKADKAGVYCSVCGEMASNPVEAMALIGLGYRNLSVSGPSFGVVKNLIRSLRIQDIADYMQILLQSNKKTLRPQLVAYAHDHGIAIL